MNVSPPRTALAPAIRAKTNRASCFLLWNTMLRLKEQGIRYFDFGGWYPGTEDIQLLGANAFKKSLGGRIVHEFECEQIVTLKGWVMLTAARLIARAKESGQEKTEILEIRPDEATA
jgi:lipid II:glycine glycyltransferase (peptidoglycan interpeptide bridge formation enzyme)